MHDGAHDLGLDLLGRSGSRGVGTHAAGVGSRVALADALVVLSSRESERGVTVRESEDRELLARHELLDDDLLTRRTELLADHNVVETGECLLLGGGDDDTLAGSETGSLENDVVLDGLDVLDGIGVRGEVAVLGGGDVVASHEVLGEGLGALHQSSTLGRTEAGDTDCFRGDGEYDSR